MSKLKIGRVFTSNVSSPYSKIEFKHSKSLIKNLDGSVAQAFDKLIVPAHWSDIAVDVLARNYLRKQGVPARLVKVIEDGVPEWIARSVADEKNDFYGSETDARQVFDRIAGAWTYWGVKGEYFDTEEDARNFYDEMRYMLAMQIAAPNSPQWFNTGLHWAYGINGAPQGHYYFDEITKQLEKSTSSYERPQPHACFIQSVSDDLVNEGGIMDLWKNEARLFKFGSGTGSNFSKIRGAGEKLSSGGYSSGLLSFLQIGDVAAGSIKSGGTTRRAAKMVILDIDHPDIESFINWKMNEETKVIDLVVGSKILSKHTKAIEENVNDKIKLQQVIKAAREDEIPDSYLLRVIDMLRYGHKIDCKEFTLNWETGAYASVFGQNSNNSVRINDAFLNAVENDEDFNLTWRASKEVAKTLKARYLWDTIAKAAWSCADPGLQFDTTINSWNTCANEERINASNPCSEYMFLDDTACNLASLNLVKFVNLKLETEEENPVHFDINLFKHATRLWTMVLEISVYMAQFPTPMIAKKSYEYRTLGLGYGNLGALLMQAGIPYDSDQGRSIAAGITALMQGVAYETSADMAKCMGAFAKFEINKSSMMRVIKNHLIAAYGGQERLKESFNFIKEQSNQNIDSQTIAASYASKEYAIGFSVSKKPLYGKFDSFENYAKLNIEPLPFNGSQCSIPGLDDAIKNTWNNVLEKGNTYGFRNAQVSVIAPTGTIGLVMDFKTTGLEPQFSHIAIKQLAGGGVWRLVNEDITTALQVLKYTPGQINEIKNYVVGHANLNGDIKLNTNWFYEKGFLPEDMQTIEQALKKAFTIGQAFSRYELGEEIFARLGIKETEYSAPAFDLLKYLGASDAEIEEADKYACGHMTIEGAPYLKSEHLPIFDCAMPCGDGTRYLSWQAHVKMMAAIQPFISGAISKTINLPSQATIDDCKEAYMLSWKLGLKAVALYRDGSKYSQVLNSKRKQALEFDDNASNEEPNKISNEAVAADNQSIHPQSVHLNQQAYDSFKPFRARGYTQHVLIGGNELWHTTGETNDEKLSNLLLIYGKEGSTLRGWTSAWGRILSMYLQDAPDSALIRVYKAFRHSKFEPMGKVQGHPYIAHANSIPDYIVSDLISAYPNMLNTDLGSSTLPPQRNGKINKVRIGQETMYIIIGEDNVGRPVEIFVAGAGNEGSDLKGWMNSCAKLISLYFQDCGDSAIWKFINAFEGSSFEPAGIVEGSDHIKVATSPLDFLAKHLRVRYSHLISNEQTTLPLVYSKHVDGDANKIDTKIDDEMQTKILKASGYKVDEPCRSCKAFKLRYNGTCYICDNCFTTTGCS